MSQIADTVISSEPETFFEDLYQSIAEQSPLAVSVVRDGTLIYHNPAYAALLGFDPESRLNGQEFPAAVESQLEREVVRNLMRRTEAGEITNTDMTVRIRTQDGSPLSVKIHFHRATVGGSSASMLYFCDTGAQSSAEAKLRRSQARLQSIIESTDDLIWSADYESGVIKTYNRAFADYLEKAYGVHIVPGEEIRAQLPQDLLAYWDLQYARAVREGGFSEEITSRQLNRRMVITLCPVRDGDVVAAVSIFAKDVTEWRDAETKEREARERMFHAEKLASLGLLAAGVVHEINNPNQYIRGNLTMLASAWKSAVPILDEYNRENEGFLLAGISYPEFRDKIAYLFSAVENGSQRISSIVSDLKSFLNLDKDRPIADIDLNEAVSAAVELCRSLIKSRTRRFVLQLGSGIPRIRAQAHRIEMVVANLIRNACEALSDPDREISVRTGIGADDLPFIAVEDEGNGMSPEELLRIQTPFYTTKRASGGTGLGLFISENIVKSYGGTLSFTSSVGKGTLARISFRRPTTT